MKLNVVAFQVFVFTVMTSLFCILADLYWLTFLNLLALEIRWQIKVLDHVHVSNSCEVVELVLLAELIKFSTQIYVYFNTVLAMCFAFDNEWFL